MVQPNQQIRLDCYVTTSGGTWSHVTVISAGLGGWLRHSQWMEGANAPC